jgi:hypothetical protein
LSPHKPISQQAMRSKQRDPYSKMYFNLFLLTLIQLIGSIIIDKPDIFNVVILALIIIIMSRIEITARKRGVR